MTGCHWLTGSCGVSVRDPPCLWAHLQAQLRDGYFHKVDKIVSYSSKSLPPSLVEGEKRPSVTTWSHHRPSPHMAASFRKSKPAREIGREVGRRSHSTLCNLIFEVTRHYFCHVLFIRNAVKRSSSQSKGRDCRSVEQEPGVRGATSRTASYMLQIKITPSRCWGETESSLWFFPFEGKTFLLHLQRDVHPKIRAGS